MRQLKCINNKERISSNRYPGRINQDMAVNGMDRSGEWNYSFDSIENNFVNNPSYDFHWESSIYQLPSDSIFPGFIEEDSHHFSMRDYSHSQSQEIFKANQLCYQNSSSTCQPSPCDANAMPHAIYNTHIIQNNTVHSQLSTQSTTNAEEQTIYKADVKKFEILEDRNSCDVFLNSRSFIGEEYNKGKRYLCVDMAEYNSLKTEEIKEFHQKLEEKFKIDKTDRAKRRKGTNKVDGKTYCPFQHEMTKYQKRTSKSKCSVNQFSSTKRYTELLKQINRPGISKEKRNELKKQKGIEKAEFYKRLKEDCLM